MMSSVLVESSDTAATIRLNRPDQKNLFDDDMLNDIHRALDQADRDRLLVFVGTGEGFSIGRPRHTNVHGGGAAARKALEGVMQLNLRVAEWRAPALAFVHGYAAGAALGMALHCDIVVAAEGTQFSFPEITYNLPPSLVASYLGRVAGHRAARYLVMTGNAIDAETALKMNLVSRVVGRDQLDLERENLIQQLGGRLPAEIEIKKSLDLFRIPSPKPAEDLRSGLDAVIQWGARMAPSQSKK